MPRISTAILLGMVALSYAHAGPITFNFMGTVSQVPIDDLGTGIQSGDSITGSFTFDSNAIDGIPDSTSASYTSTGAAYGLSADIGAGPVMFLISGSLNIGILNTFIDQYTVSASSSLLTVDLLFEDDSATVFSSDGLPLSPPPLAGFGQRQFHLDQTDLAGDETQVDGTITFLTCDACGAQAAPEPSTAGALFIWRSHA